MTDEQRKAMFARLHESGQLGQPRPPGYNKSAGKTGLAGRYFNDRLTSRERQLFSGAAQPIDDTERVTLKKLKDIDFEARTGYVVRPDGAAESFEAAQGRAVRAEQDRRDNLNFLQRALEDLQNKPRPVYPSEYAGVDWKGLAHDVNPANWDWKAITAALPAAGMVGTAGMAGNEAISWGRVGLRALQSTLAGLLAHELNQTRKDNPTMDPGTEHYLAMGEDLAKTVAAITGLLGAKDAVLKTLPGVTGKGADAARWIGAQLEVLGGAVAEKTPAPVLDKLGKVKSAYDAVADFTGAELPQLTKAGGIIEGAQQAGTLSRQAAAARTQAQIIAEAATAKADALRAGTEPSAAAARLETLAAKVESKAAEFSGQAQSISETATAKGASVRSFALDALNDSHVMSLLDDPAAKALYDENAARFFATLQGEAGSAATSSDLADIAARLTAKATEIRGRIPGAIQTEAEAGVASSAKSVAALLEEAQLMDSQAAQVGRAAATDAAKIAFVVGGGAAIHAYEQNKVADYKQQIEKAWSEGKSWTLPADPDYVDTPTTLAANFAVGTLGNPIEKQTRNYFNGRYTLDLAKRAAYEAKYETIQKAHADGKLTAAERDAQLQDLAKYKPYNLAGRSLYTFTPATAGMLKYLSASFSDSAYSVPSVAKSSASNQFYTAGQTLNDVGNVLGVGLLTSGQSGAFNAMGKSGKLTAQAWNAAMSALGTAEHAFRGNKQNQPKTYQPPRSMSGHATNTSAHARPSR